MPLPTEIKNSLHVYDSNKGFWRRLFRRDQAAVRALRTLSDADNTDRLKIYQCFIGNIPNSTQESYKVYQAVLVYLNNLNCGDIPEVIDTLHFANLLKTENLDKLTTLKGSHFQILAKLLTQLNTSNLLTQKNFDDILKHFGAHDENRREALAILGAAIDTLHEACLTQENLDSLLEKPMQAVGMAAALKVLNSNHLLTPANRIKLYNDNNQFLLSGESYYLVWRPFITYLPTLDNIDKRQWVFDRILDLAQEEEPEEKIADYMRRLNAQPLLRIQKNLKFSTTPANIHTRRSSLVSNPYCNSSFHSFRV